MTSLEQQTAVKQIADGKYQGNILEDWKMWVPVGGYLTSIALRAAQASSTMVRPLSISCHYLNEATFGPCELDVEILRSTDRYESLLVRMTQDGKDILVCLVSAAPSGLLGPEITWHEKPDSPAPEELEQTILDQDVIDIMGDQPYWKNLEFRMIRGLTGSHNYPHLEGLTDEEFTELRFTPRRDAHIRGWQRMECGEGFTDPWVDAGRYIIIAAGLQFPVVADPYTPPLKFIAPTVNLTVDFHTFHPEEQWMLADATGTHASDGLLGADTRMWARNGDLLVTAHSQMTYHDFSEPKVTEGMQTTWFDLRETDPES
jgi:acyl-CoA thioesterase